MRDRPEGVDDAELVSALADGWRLGIRSVAYLPVGAGSYHWSVVDDQGQAWFVTVNDLGVQEETRESAFAGLGRAFNTAFALSRDAGLEFVVAPVPARDAATVWRLNSRYAVSVFPTIDGEAGHFGPHRSQDRGDVLEMLIRLHHATPVVAADTTRAELALPGRDRLQDALHNLDRTWSGGPFSEPTRRLLSARRDRVEQMLSEFDRLVEQVRATNSPWVVTHGEPHPGNLIRSADGLRLIDWDTVRIAPPERDLWLVAGDSEDLLAEYTRATGRQISSAALACYRLRWDLDDIAIYVDELRRPHRATEDITASWTYLNRYLD